MYIHTDHVKPKPSTSFTDRKIGIEPVAVGSCGICIICFAFAIPFNKMGFGDGANNHDINDIPERKKITKNIKTNIINANFATILFEFKNSFEPSKYTFVGVMDAIEGISGKDGKDDNNPEGEAEGEGIVVFVFVSIIYNIILYII
jgi:hypothetical protein